MKILVTGARGQLGAEICRQLGPVALPVDIHDFDITYRRAVLKAIEELRPRAIINCAAYTLVDQAEIEPARCQAVNAAAVEHLADAALEVDCPLVQISTDYVFHGPPDRTVPYRETDVPEPRSVYARTKLEGERAAARVPRHLIVRTCGLYARRNGSEGPLDSPLPQAGQGVRAEGAKGARNFVTTILRMAQSRPVLKVVDDQHCAPSYVPHVARAVRFLLGADEKTPDLQPPGPWGIYHVTNGGATTWYEFAGEIVRRAGLSTRIEPITTAEFGAAAPRPGYSVLDTSAYHRLGGPPMPDWREALAEYFAG